MTLINLFPILIIMSIVCIVLFLVLKLIFDVNTLFLVILPFIVTLPIFLILLGILIDYKDIKRELRPLLFTFYYSVLSCLILIIYIFTKLIIFALPVFGLFLMILVLIGIYGHRFYINDKNRRELIAYFENNESYEERNSGITYGKVK